ncbi:hypothetical protein [Flavobacterium sp. Leaf82]|uniref:hypothetical protein n=1 Tax=Flavobacterium sp. Leaf82 TaxID=1736238 RepID=UPI0006FCDC5B|nr:hypothetical protein [Flavobacterium sp. Leaf82]
MNLRNKIFMYILVLVLLILIIIPLFLFVLKFNSYSISDNVEDWVFFGDYLGGTVNTAISFSSLIFLGYLTYLLSKQSNSENKKNNILMRRMDAYDELTSFLPQINQFLFDFSKSANTILDKITEKPLNVDLIIEKKLELNRQIVLFKNFYSLLFSFNVRYGHLFDYDFNSEDYNKIVKKADTLKTFFEKTIDFLNGEMDTPNIIEDDLMRTFFDDLVVFINLVRKELK